MLYQSAHLVVTGASAEHIIAMKMRVGRDIDWEDIERVAKHRGIESASELERIHDAVFPGEALPERSRIRLREWRSREARDSTR